jgi:hypothetical protein
MHGYLKDYFLIDYTCRMSFFPVEEAMAEETEVEVTETEAQEGLGSLYILMLIQKSLAKCFMQDSLIGLGRK